jgi:hypothetical protein
LKRIVLEILTAFAGFLFVISAFLPFLTIGWFVGYIFDPNGMTVTFWSFRDAYGFHLWEAPFFVSSREQYSFVDYWRDLHGDYGGVWEGVVILMFIAQVLTVLSGVGGIFLRRLGSFWSFLAGIYSVVTVFCMITFVMATKASATLFARLEAGFWLALISSALFFFSFVVSWKWK